MDDNCTPVDPETLRIRQQMDETRVALTDKLGVLEQQVAGTVETVKDSVNTVKNTLDLKMQVRKRPWTLLAGAAALGLVAGYRSSAGRVYRRSESLRNVYEARHLAQQARRPPVDAPQAPGIFEKEISLLKGLAVGAVLGLVRDVALQSVSGHAERYIGEAIDGITHKLGARPIPTTKSQPAVQTEEPAPQETHAPPASQ